jgi:hypothetical protein
MRSDCLGPSLPIRLNTVLSVQCNARRRCRLRITKWFSHSTKAPRQDIQIASLRLSHPSAKATFFMVGEMGKLEDEAWFEETRQRIVASLPRRSQEGRGARPHPGHAQLSLSFYV